SIIKAIHKSYTVLTSQKLSSEIQNALAIMESKIKKAEEYYDLKDFIMETFSSKICVYANMCRIKAREVERRAVSLKLHHIYAFWNRLSDYFFVVMLEHEPNKKTYKDL
ncbi:MAG: ATP:cob(I)alamin adenosyltransferase, partial [Candidatus Nanohaloarchaeota archaeon]|nr:ATP:cob(I)alamin adenosyltransferase [Candidatus Nanohaloarchaeota archaeon]